MPSCQYLLHSLLEVGALGQVADQKSRHPEGSSEINVETKQSKETIRLRYLVGAVLIVITLFLALAPGTFSPLRPLTNEWLPSLSHRDARIAAHILGFSGLVVVMSWVTRRLIAATVIVFVLAMSIELIQAFLPWRDGTWKDVGLNLIALGLGLGIAWLLRIGKSPGQSPK